MRYVSWPSPSSSKRTVLPIATTPDPFVVLIKTWFLMIASSSLTRASIIPWSFLAAWYSKFSERSPNSRAALIFATIAGRLTVVSSWSSLLTASSPSGLMRTSLVIIPSLVLGDLSLDLLHQTALQEGRHPAHDRSHR